VEIPSVGLRPLSLYAGDDPSEAAARFCAQWQHQDQLLQEALAALLEENIQAMGLQDKVKHATAKEARNGPAR